MSKIQLVAMSNGTDYLEVHPSTVESHRRVGWRECEKKEATGPTRAELDAALASLPGEHKDPEYVVNAMRAHFGELFTDDDEARVRELVKAPLKKPSDGLKVEEIKAELEKRGIAIPEGVTLKADLAALLDKPAQQS